MAARAPDPRAGADEGPLWLLLHELDDLSAEPLRRCLAPAAQAAGGCLLSVPAPALLQARHWSLRMEADGRTCASIQLGRHQLAGHRLRAVLNRLGPPLLSGGSAEAGYQQQEWQAILAFWLASLPCAVLNAAHPLGLSGLQASAPRWRLLAGRAGLPVVAGSLPPPAERARLRLLVLGRHCLPGPEARTLDDAPLLRWQRALPSFAAALGLAMLEVWLSQDAHGRWLLDRADARPDLRSLDTPLQSSLLECLGLGTVRVNAAQRQAAEAPGCPSRPLSPPGGAPLHVPELYP